LSGGETAKKINKKGWADGGKTIGPLRLTDGRRISIRGVLFDFDEVQVADVRRKSRETGGGVKIEEFLIRARSRSRNANDANDIRKKGE